jgi:isocitrate dehydrogenase
MISKLGKNVIAVAKGDGIGPEIMDAALHVLKSAGVPLTFKTIEMGKSIYLAGHSAGMTQEAKETIETTGILYKGPMETPKGTGVKSINVTARKVIEID